MSNHSLSNDFLCNGFAVISEGEMNDVYAGDADNNKVCTNNAECSSNLSCKNNQGCSNNGWCHNNTTVEV